MKENDLFFDWLAACVGFISGIIALLITVACILSLTSCAVLEGPAWHPPLALPDSTRTVIVAKNYYAGTYKDRSDRRAAGGGTFVAKASAAVATGTGQAQDFRKAGQHGGALATAPGASAGATTRTGLPIWALVAGGILLLLLLLLGLAYAYRRQLSSWLKISV